MTDVFSATPNPNQFGPLGYSPGGKLIYVVKWL